MIDLRDLAQEYVTTFGFGLLNQIKLPFEASNPENQQRNLAHWYDKVEDNKDDSVVSLAYQKLALEVAAQFGFLVAKGIDFQPTSKPDSYKNGLQILEALDERVLFVFDLEHNHSVLTSAQNFMLRAVHDVFAHAMPKTTFGPRGEYIGYLNHRQMFSPLAALAYATETHAQNSWFNYGPFSLLPASERPFAPQKAVLIPKEFRIPFSAGLHHG